jgi:SHS2 domain-containing protein
VSAPPDNRWEHFPHEADMGVRGVGRSLPEAFEQAALALTAITDPARVAPRPRSTSNARRRTLELLLADWLNALIYEMATRPHVVSRFSVNSTGAALRAAAWGETVDVARHEPAVEAKGAT